ncbi:mannose-6-phosphate isomerase, class I [Clostridium sp. D2Q-14]|uniref:mannose-6-phosphate isomerase, class I n=1 Tax=Anaeromonas gelatinilytica TaxID=2683194 RepID=UPI00193BA42E|nr:mannose-6-phosphate isomerase, class I [Anaeromonas gelatinilytica]MBS4536777.1 mannose-6-phosphate isomerase, class I [Anaeromonas gelatinilytica]
MNSIIFLESKLVEKIWGGTRLKEYFGYEIPNENIGEYWAVSAHPNAESVIKYGEFKGKKLSWLWDNHREIFGNIEGKEFPLLTKIIDASDDLSVQVHPNDEYAKKHENGSLGKTECWYIIDCEKDSELVLGHNAESKEEMKQMIDEGKWDKLLRKVKINPGDFFYIPAGTVHAIGSGTMILETQQTSDITYRVYDYNRLQNGKKRELHIEKSIDVATIPYKDIKLEKYKKNVNGNIIEKLVETNYFTICKLYITSSLDINQDKSFIIMSVLAGKGSIDGIDIKKGQHFIIPALYGKFKLEGNMEIVYSYI